MKFTSIIITFLFQIFSETECEWFNGLGSQCCYAKLILKKGIEIYRVFQTFVLETWLNSKIFFVCVVLQLCHNQLTGNIPKQMGSLTRLSVLALQYNRLNGSIPASLENLKKLKRLDLSFNGFSGRIPAGLANISQLDFLDVQNNSLFGFVPPGMSISYILDYSTKILLLTLSFLLLWLCIDLY